VLKAFKDKLSPVLCSIFNNCVQYEIFPDVLKVANIAPVYKGGDISDYSNFRPISLLSSISKIFERIIYDQLLGYLLENKLLSESQFGFLPNRSTQDAFHLLSQSILTALNNSQKACAIFLDISKAFDTVSHARIVKKLKCFGLNSASCKLIRSYLSNRQQRVKIGNVLSELRDVIYGVPQGSVLGPLLFILYMNDMYVMQTNSQILSFADDTCLIFTGESNEDLYARANSGLLAITKWMIANSLAINKKKTVFIHFTLGQTGLDPTRRIILHGMKDVCLCTNMSCSCEPVTEVLFTKYLGIILDQNLRFKNHICSLLQKIRFGVYVLSRLKNVATISFKKNHILFFYTVTHAIRYHSLGWDK